jgi:hypothetical protein
MVEESDEQYEIQRAKISVAELKKTGMKITLNLKKFENDKKRSKSDPKKKADENNILSYTVSRFIWNSFINSYNANN